MNNALLSAFDRALDQPVWNRILMLAVLSAGCCALLYFFLLSAVLQQRQAGRQQNAGLQQAILQQQKTLLTQPALAVLLQQQRPLVAGRERQPVALLEQMTAPLRESKSTLVKWLPAEGGVSSLQGEPEVEQGNLSVKASFNDVMRLMSQLADGPNSPSLDQLSLRAGDGHLDVRFYLSAESVKPKVLTTDKDREGIVRDPFTPAKSASCPDPAHSFKGVLLGGIIGSSGQRQSWLRWPDAGWQKASPGWRDGASGWRVDTVTPASVLFELDHPPCVIQQFKLQFGGQ